MRHTRECLKEFLAFAEEGILPGNYKQAETGGRPDQDQDESVVSGEDKPQSTNQDEVKVVVQEKLSGLPPSPKGETMRPPGNPPMEMLNTQEEGPAWVQSFMKGLTGTMANVGLAIREAMQINKASKEKEEEKKTPYHNLHV